MRNLNRNSRTVVLCALLGTFLAGDLVAQQYVSLKALPQIGDRISVPRGVGESMGVCMTSPGQIDSCLKVSVFDVKYTVGFRKKSRLGRYTVTYLHTDDPAFRSPDGEHVGDTVLVSKRTGLIAAPGFEVYAGRSRGWLRVVGFNGEVSVVSPTGDHKVPISDVEQLEASGNIRLKIVGFTRIEHGAQ